MVPPFKLLEIDSAPVFSNPDLTKNIPVLIILFSPYCNHCKHETEETIKHIDNLKKVQIIMATTMPVTAMKDFIKNMNRGNLRI
jgi:thiol-disulfide isomerase/thioredoxin